MSILTKIIGEALGPVVGLIDSLHTSDEERARAHAELFAIQATFADKLVEYERDLAKEQGATLRAEVTGHSWLQRNWRPLLMLLFGYIIAHNYVISPLFAVASVPIPPDMWGLVKLGMGGYVMGRTVEKVAPDFLKAFGKG